MTNKLQRDPSTLKLMRDAATGKLMRAISSSTIPSECFWCDTLMPASIRVILSGFTDCSCAPLGGVYVKTSNIGSEINANWNVYHSSGCVYQTDFDVNLGPYLFYISEGCPDDPYDTMYFDKLRIRVTATETGVDFQFWIRQSESLIWYKLFFNDECTDSRVFSIVYTGDDVCLNTENTVENDLTACVNGACISLGGCTGIISIELP